METTRTLFIIEIALFTALALALDLIPFLKFKIWAQGGSISFAMIPVFIVAFRWGLKGGLLSGLLFGVMQIPFGAYILTPLQGFIEYGLAFTALGVAGIFSRQIKEALSEGKTTTYLGYITLGVLLGTFLRFIGHFTAGIVFFAEYLPEGFSNIWVYSFIYNISYMLPSFIISTIAIFYLFHKQPRTMLNKAA